MEAGLRRSQHGEVLSGGASRRERFLSLNYNVVTAVGYELTMAKTVDEKLLFPAYDTTPSFMGWRNFRRNALTHGGSYTDDDGWSYADVFLGRRR